MGDAWRPRVERLFRTNRTPLIVLALAALAAGGIWTLQAVTATETYDEVHIEDRRVESGVFTYEAPVPSGTPGFEDGTVLGMEEPGYFTTLTPALHVAFVWRIVEPDAMRTGAHITLRLVGTPTGMTTAAWEHTLDTRTFAPGTDEPRQAEGIVDLPEAQRAVHEQLEQQGRKTSKIDWRFVADVTWVADDGADRATGNTTYTLPFTVDAPLVVLPQGADTSHQVDHGRRIVTSHSNVAGAGAIITHPGGPLALGIGATVIALAAWTARPESMPENERVTLTPAEDLSVPAFPEARQEEKVIR